LQLAAQRSKQRFGFAGAQQSCLDPVASGESNNTERSG
jgi:hypothetical protein